MMLAVWHLESTEKYLWVNELIAIDIYVKNHSCDIQKKKNLRMSNNFEDGSELCIPGGASGKSLPANARDLRDIGLIPGLGEDLWWRHSNPSILPQENPMDKHEVYSP